MALYRLAFRICARSLTVRDRNSVRLRSTDRDELRNDVNIGFALLGSGRLESAGY
ncbi:MAG TPA: hypothetical protein VNU97_16265 [Rhizomicrobium sp.]|jgi:hypothetical protein|nr:hypothetical protein [Rhizomicrobium sp.]